MDVMKFYTKDVVPPEYRENVGEHTYGAPRIVDFGEGTTVRIGRYCSIAEGVVILLGGNHRVDWLTTYPFPALSLRWPEADRIEGHPRSRGDVRIGNDVWIGTEAMILSGVTIGDGAVIGARAVVARDVPPYAIVAGNPARVVRMRFGQETVDHLLAIRWWDWPDHEVQDRLSILCSPDIDELLRHAPPAGLAGEAAPVEAPAQGITTASRAGLVPRLLNKLLRNRR